jgi:hypothetical protein
MKALVSGWFSFEQGHATAGDLLALDLACEWLECAGYTYDVALAPPFPGGVDWRIANPQNYSHVVFVCGPFQKGELESEFLAHFADCRLIGLDLSMPIPLDVWNPFDLLFERDSSAGARPDITFLSRRKLLPVVGVCLVEPYEGALDHVANAAIQRLVDSREITVVPIDTRLDMNSTGLRSPSEVASLLARMDVVVTTRLHGTVLALKHGVPVLAIDPEAGGAKIRRQAETIGWPIVFTADAVTHEALQKAFDYCLTGAARAKARECCERAMWMVEATRNEFISALTRPGPLDHIYLARLSGATHNARNTQSQGSNDTACEIYAASGELLGRRLERNSRAFLKLLVRRVLPASVHGWLRLRRKGDVVK